MATEKEEGPPSRGRPSGSSTNNRSRKRTRRRRQKSGLPPCTCTGYGTCEGCRTIDARREQARQLRAQKGGPRG